MPASNARYALNAANARWGSLYDALYGTDVIPETDGAERGKGYNKIRGAKVIDWVRAFLDDVAPLAKGSHKAVTAYKVAGGELVATLQNGLETRLRHPGRFAGYQKKSLDSFVILLRHHGLHIEIEIDQNSLVGAESKAGVADVILEAALSTIIDLEDSAAAVDAQDKVGVYRNWLGLMQGSLTANLEKNGLLFERRLNEGSHLYRPGRCADDLAWAQSFAGAQCRPSYRKPMRCSTKIGQPNSRNHSGCRGHHVDRDSMISSVFRDRTTAATVRSTS